MARPALMEMSKLLFGDEVEGNAWQATDLMHEFTPSAMTTTTFTHVTFVGWNVWDIGAIVEPESGPCKGLRRMVTEMAGGPGTATVSPPWPVDPSVSGTIEPGLRAWKPGEAIVIAVGAGSAITVAARGFAAGANLWGINGRLEAAGTWADDAVAGTNLGDRWCLVCIGTVTVAPNNLGLVSRVVNQTDGSAADPTFSIDPCTGWVAGGAADLYLLRKEAEPVGPLPLIPTTRPMYESEVSGKGTMMREAHILGPAKPAGPFTYPTYLRRLHSPATAAASARGPSTIGDILKRIGSVSAPLNGACGAGSTNVLIALAGGEVPLMIPGNLVMIDGEVTMITNVNDGPPTMDIYPPLKAAPANLTPIQQGWNWKPITDGHGTIVVDAYLRRQVDAATHDQRRQATGWLPSWKFDGVEPNAIPQIIFEGPFAGTWRDGLSYDYIAGTAQSTPGKFPQPDHRAAISTSYSRCVLNATRLSKPVSWSLDLGMVTLLKGLLDGPFSGDGCYVDDIKTVGMLSTHLQDFEAVRQYEEETEKRLLYQAGNTGGDTYAWFVYSAQLTDAQEEWNGARGAQPMPFAANDPNTYGTYIATSGDPTSYVEMALPGVVQTWF